MFGVLGTTGLVIGLIVVGAAVCAVGFGLM